MWYNTNQIEDEYENVKKFSKKCMPRSVFESWTTKNKMSHFYNFVLIFPTSHSYYVDIINVYMEIIFQTQLNNLHEKSTCS